MNPFLSSIAHKAGMVLRPEFYSGRGANRGDVPPEKLADIYTGVRLYGALKGFPPGAADAFARMVISMPALTGTAFCLDLRTLDERGYMWDAKFPHTDARWDLPSEERVRGFAAQAIVVAALAGDSSDLAADAHYSLKLKRKFVQLIEREDLLTDIPIPPPILTINGCIYAR